jgi:hypothetical protein
MEDADKMLRWTPREDNGFLVVNTSGAGAATTGTVPDTQVQAQHLNSLFDLPKAGDQRIVSVKRVGATGGFTCSLGNADFALAAPPVWVEWRSAPGAVSASSVLVSKTIRIIY